LLENDDGLSLAGQYAGRGSNNHTARPLLSTMNQCKITMLR